jgi:hypothetical protein
MAARKPKHDVDTILARLAEIGVLLLHDVARPSLSGLIAGEAIRGSWWSHPAGKQIYAVGEALGHHPDVLACKLLDGKITFVHRRLWPALSVVGRARAAWQTRGLTDEAQTLLARIVADGLLRIESGDSAAGKLLEERMLVLGERVHTDAGHHATELMSWPHWGRKVKLDSARLPVGDAQRQLEIAVALGATGMRLPWQGLATKPKSMIEKPAKKPAAKKPAAKKPAAKKPAARKPATRGSRAAARG